MKTALIIAAVVGGYVLVRRKQLGHMPHSLAELVPFGKPCACKGTAATATVGTEASRVPSGGGESPPFVPEVSMRDADVFGGVSAVYGGGMGGACS